MAIIVLKSVEDTLGGGINVVSDVAGQDKIVIVVLESANDYTDAPPTLNPANGNTFTFLGSVGTGTAGGATATKLSVFWCRLNAAASIFDTILTPVAIGNVAQIIRVDGHAVTVDPEIIASSADATVQSSVSFSAGATTRSNAVVLYVVTTSRDSNGNDFTGSSVSSPSITITDLGTTSSNVGNGGGIDTFYSTVLPAPGSAGTFNATNTGNGVHAFMAIELYSTSADDTVYGNSGGAGPLMMMLLTENG